ncbi:max-like protein X isoform X1 [Branchiostoma floridae]|uniref:Max-like protein X n=1 Tax=Branchiostoma floridae TaxID=7739 RepID=A0A9J7HD28_BRAFL|nr:max-like protein X isoform X1 [Branchiostoma floridae]
MADGRDDVWRTLREQHVTALTTLTNVAAEAPYVPFAAFSDGDLKMDSSAGPSPTGAGGGFLYQRSNSTHTSESSVPNTAFGETDFKAGDFEQRPYRQNSFSSRASTASEGSSVPNTDDEDSDAHHSASSYKERRRNAHTAAEQKRRDAIKKGYDELQQMVPTCQTQDQIGSQKLSKATVLQRSIDYISFLVQQKKKQEDELDALRKDVMALKIMKGNYEEIVEAHQNTPTQGQNQVSDEVKFNVFRSVMDHQFQSFNQSISVASFAELSACVFSWLEEHCKPQTLRELMLGVLRQVNNQLF